MSLRDDLIRDEKDVPYAYQDSRGYWTIGIGFLVDMRTAGRMPPEVRDFWINLLLERNAADMDRLMPWWREQPEWVQRGLGNMCYQLGIHGLLGFHDALVALQNGDYDAAQVGFRDSPWAKTETPARAARVIALFSAGGPDGVGGTNGSNGSIRT